MNREQTKQAVIVMMESLKDDAVVEANISGKWVVCDSPTWNWGYCDFRIQQKPKIVERWVVSDDQGNQLTYRTLHESRHCADAWEQYGRTGITLTHLKGEEQPWHK